MRSFRIRDIEHFKKYITLLESGDQLILWANHEELPPKQHKEITLSVLENKLIFHTIKDVVDHTL